MLFTKWSARTGCAPRSLGRRHLGAVVSIRLLIADEQAVDDRGLAPLRERSAGRLSLHQLRGPDAERVHLIAVQGLQQRPLGSAD
jgi:hypothetical protein